MSLKVGVNIVSMTHLAPAPVRQLFFANSSDLISQALEIGFDFIQLLPIRGTDGDEMSKVAPSALRLPFYEEAWNAGSIANFLLKRAGTAGTPQKLHDIVLFPSPAKCEDVTARWRGQGIRRISHDFSTGDNLVELHPGLMMDPAGILEICRRNGVEMVVDTSHLRRDFRPDEISRHPFLVGKPSQLGTTREEWLSTLSALAPVLAPVMHLNVPSVDSYLRHRDLVSIAILRSWLDLTEGFEERQIVLEYNPGKAVLSGSASRRLAKDMFDKTSHVLRK